MQLRSFSVQGYKNLCRRIDLDTLGRLNVFHGENSTGKSNLLEAIGLFFFLLSRDSQSSKSQPADTVSRKALELAGFPVADIFQWGEQSAIELTAVLVFNDASEYQMRLTLSPPRTKNIDEPLNCEREDHLHPSLRKGDLLKTAKVLVNREAYRLVSVDRRLQYGPIGQGERAEAMERREEIPPELAKRLFDLKQDRSEIYDQFLSALARFPELLPGTPDVVWSRTEDRARIVFDPPGRKGPSIKAQLLGAGTQQIIALLGQGLVGGVPVLAIEEPERGLRYPLQLRLRDALLSLLAPSPTSEGLPQQIFLTSHSDAFEDPADGATFFALTQDDEGPRVTRRSTADAADFTGLRSVLQVGSGKAPLCYVTREGRVRLPDDVRDALGLREGGGIVFDVDAQTRDVRMLTNAQFLDRIEPKKV